MKEEIKKNRMDNKMESSRVNFYKQNFPRT